MPDYREEAVHKLSPSLRQRTAPSTGLRSVSGFNVSIKICPEKRPPEALKIFISG